MEKIVGEMFGSKQVDEGVIEAVWDKIETFGHSPTLLVQDKMQTNASGIRFSELGACLRIIAMVAQFVPNTLDDERISLVIDVGLGAEVLRKCDFSALKAAALCLQATPAFLKCVGTVAARNAYLGSKLQKALLSATPTLTTILVGGFCGHSEALTREWFSLCEEAMHALFHLHPSPDRVVGLVLQHMYAGLGDASRLAMGAGAAANGAGPGAGSVFPIVRLQFVLGQTALCSVVFTEFVAATAKKYPVKSEESAATATTATAAAGSKTKGGGGAAKKKEVTGTFQENEGAVDAMEEEMGAAAAADADHDRVRTCYTHG
jgi:hypothetical protein